MSSRENTDHISPSGKYKVSFEDDPEKNTYYIVSITSNAEIVYQYKCEKNQRICAEFISINGIDWWFGARDYTTRLFVNCETGEMYDKFHQDVDINYIWGCISEISPNQKYILVEGCIWACPYEWKVYDISDLTNVGYREIDLLNDIEIYDIYNKKCEFFDISDSDEYGLMFSDDNKISIYDKNRKLIGYAKFS